MFLLGCQYQWKWLTGKIHLRNDPQCVDGTLNANHSLEIVNACYQGQGSQGRKSRGQGQAKVKVAKKEPK